MSDLIDRQAAIDAIEQMQMPIMRSEFPEEQFVFTGMSEALRAIKDLPSAQPEIRYYGQFEIKDPILISAQQWIPCSERLPEEDNWLGGSGKQFSDSVLMTVLNTIEDEKIIDYGYTTDGEWYSETTECYIPHGWKVIAWMPLPEPYNGEQA